MDGLLESVLAAAVLIGFLAGFSLLLHRLSRPSPDHPLFRFPGGRSMTVRSIGFTITLEAERDVDICRDVAEHGRLTRHDEQVDDGAPRSRRSQGRPCCTIAAMPDPSRDARIRAAVFAFLTEQTSRLGEVLPWSVLTSGFVLDGKTVPLLGAAGIWKPAVFPELPLSIATAPPVEGSQRPYEDGIDAHGLLTYRTRGTDPAHRDNVGLRRAMT